MIPSLAVMVGLLVQAVGNPSPARGPSAPEPVRVWRADSTVVVTLREPGHLVVLHVDAIGRIQVLFPAGPDDDSGMLSNDTLVAIPLPPTAEGNPATFVAVRSRWPFEFGALRAGSAWNYYGALLLQPTAGDPLGALLDIADRVTDGRPYDYAEVTYSRAGTVVARGPVRSEEHTSELQSRSDLVCRLLLEKKKKNQHRPTKTNEHKGFNRTNTN